MTAIHMEAGRGDAASLSDWLVPDAARRSGNIQQPAVMCRGCTKRHGKGAC